MKLKLALLVIFALCMVAVSSPTPNIGDGAIIKDVLCNVCDKACDAVANKCYQSAKGDKTTELCRKIDQSCHAQCPC